MSKRCRALLVTLLGTFSWSVGDVVGQSPLTSLIPFRRVEADAKKTYTLTDEHGPWLVLAATFAGAGAEKQAHDLVLELRSRYKLTAYIHRQVYDYTQTVKGTKLTQTGEPARMKYANAERYEGLAVLVGDYRSVDDPELEKTLERIKYAKPDCLDIAKNKSSTQRFAALRALQHRMNLNPEKNSKGPMGSAFATRNPLLPDEYFAHNGVDDFVARLNKGVEYSLLDNPGKFTVKVATFRGAMIDQRDIDKLDGSKPSNKLEIAADKAHRLTMALRKHSIEAYEFHDRTESCVTVGSFESDGKLLPSGAVEINPQMYAIIEKYKAVPRNLPGHKVVGLQPRVLDGITFDVQPLPIEVPRRSVSADYSRPRGE